MTLLDQVVILWSLLWCLYASHEQFWAGVEHPSRTMRLLRSMISVLALAYGLGYVWLLMGADVFLWSRIFRGVTVVTWPVVWWLPAHLSRREQRRQADVKARLAEKLDPYLGGE